MSLSILKQPAYRYLQKILRGAPQWEISLVVVKIGSKKTVKSNHHKYVLV
jgi:hypothetical protein